MGELQEGVYRENAGAGWRILRHQTADTSREERWEIEYQEYLVVLQYIPVYGYTVILLVDRETAVVVHTDGAADWFSELRRLNVCWQENSTADAGAGRGYL